MNKPETVHVYRSVSHFDHLVFKYQGEIKVADLDQYVEQSRNPLLVKETFLTFPTYPQADRITFTETCMQAPTPTLTFADSGIMFVSMRSGVQIFNFRQLPVTV